MSKRNKIYVVTISSIFIFLLIWCPMSYILNKTGIVKINDLGNYKDPEKSYENGILAPLLNSIEQGKADLSNLYTNYLPAYGRLIDLVNTSETSLNLAFVKALTKNPPAPAVLEAPDKGAEQQGAAQEPAAALVKHTAIKLSHDEGLHAYYAIYPEELIDTALYMDEDNMQSRMEYQLEQLNRIIAADEQVNFFFYLGKRMQDNEYFAEIVPGEISTAKYCEEFLSRIEGAEGVDALNVDTLEARLENVFRTDHHWSAKGSYNGYVDVLNMMREVTSDIGDAMPLKGLIEYPEVKMRGSASKISQFKDFYEPFAVVDVDLPEVDTYARMRSQKRVYAMGDADRGTFFDHYDAYYSKPDKLIYPTVKNGRNLLIIGDSYTWWFTFLLGAHFENTYMFYPWSNEKLDYNKFIEENAITDVLFMQFSDRIMFNAYNDCPLKNIRTP